MFFNWGGLISVKWVTHILWGVAVLLPLSTPLTDAFTASVVHTVATDKLGHEKRGHVIRRSRVHNAASIAAAVALALFYRNPYMVLLGPLHIALDLISPGRWAVSPWYNALFSIIALVIIFKTLSAPI
jgi:hypothetical protein